jgi:hypothetical protein
MENIKTCHQDVVVLYTWTAVLCSFVRGGRFALVGRG